MKLIRVFPRKTKATPEDENVRFSAPSLFDEADAVDISVTFEQDKPKSEDMAELWLHVTPHVEIGGPAYSDPGGEFKPGKYLKPGYVFTSRGCPNDCWFCKVHKREGEIRELKINDGYNILDSNLLACSDSHIKNVFEMLKRQKEKPRFTGGLDPELFRPWIAEEFIKLKPKTAYFAYDDPHDYEHLINATNILREYEIIPDSSHSYFCYVLIGYDGDTFEKAEKRLNQINKMNLFPMAMLYDKEIHRKDNDGWIKFQREWANHKITGNTMAKA